VFLGMVEHLKEETYYADSYDFDTVEECLKTIEYWKKAFNERANAKELMDLSPEEKIRPESFCEFDLKPVA
jgi:hypothetical protein